MSISYNKMWKLLIDKKMSKVSLRKAAEIAPNTMIKLHRDEAVNLAILGILPSELFCNAHEKAASDENLNETLETIFRHIKGSANGSFKPGPPGCFYIRGIIYGNR